MDKKLLLKLDSELELYQHLLDTTDNEDLKEYLQHKIKETEDIRENYLINTKKYNV